LSIKVIKAKLVMLSENIGARKPDIIGAYMMRYEATNHNHISPTDIHMDTQASKSSAIVGLPDVRMPPLSNDTITGSPLARPGTTLKNSRFQLWERELLESSEVRRKSTVAQLCSCYRAKIQYMLTPPLRFPRLLLPTFRVYQRSQRTSGKIR
jgi:hypothetical protein